MDIALLLVRLAGLALAAHGAQKLFGWFGGYGLEGTGGFFHSVGFRPGKLMAFNAGVLELVGGLLLVLGLGAPVAGLVIAAVMVPAIATHWPKFFAQSGGYELALTYLALGVVFAFGGFGAYSLDAVFGIAHLWTAAHAWIGLAVGVLGGLVVVAARRRDVAAAVADAA
jgi:putative oxidoreductase